MSRTLGTGTVAGTATTPDTVRPLGVVKLTGSGAVSADADLPAPESRAAIGRPPIRANTTRRGIVIMTTSPPRCSSRSIIYRCQFDGTIASRNYSGAIAIPWRDHDGTCRR